MIACNTPVIPNVLESYVGAILQQLGLDQTFFIQFAIIAGLFLILANLYFKPFLKLFEARHKRTVQDREAAEKLMALAQTKFEEYKKSLAEERASARKEFEIVLAQSKKEESAILSQARDEAKKITQETMESISKQREAITKQLDADVESLAKSISEKLLSR